MNVLVHGISEYSTSVFWLIRRQRRIVCTADLPVCRDGQCRGYIFFDTVQLNYQSQTQANTTRRKVETPQRHFWYILSQENVSDHSPASVVL